MKKDLRKLLSGLVLVAILVTMTATVFAGDAGYDGAAFGNRLDVEGFPAGDALFAWVDRADENAVGEKINVQTLYPQRTGWQELDKLMEEIFAKAGQDADAHTKLKYAYDYLVKNVTYSWEGYSYTVASVASYNSVNGYDYLSKMTYEEGLQKSISDDMANRTYHILKDKKGVCYDYAIAIAVMARYLGLNAYVETGLFVFEDTSNGAGHHGWALVEIGDETYIFDPQRDARNYQYYGRNGYYYGIPYETGLATNYRPSYYSSDVTANRLRREEMLPVTAERAGEKQVTVTLIASRSGVALGSGTVGAGTDLNICAQAVDAPFEGWYSPDGTLVSDQADYTLTPEGNMTLIAMFRGDLFYDIPKGSWYEDYAVEACEKGLIQGTAPFVFSPDMTLTRGMVVTILANMSGGDTASAAPCPFEDVSPEAWYYRDICWAYEQGIINGIDESHFAPDQPVIREQLLAMIMRYLDVAGVETEEKELSYTDVEDFSAYALPYARKAESIGLIEGYTDGSFQPLAQLPRREGVTILVRLDQYLRTVIGEE